MVNISLVFENLEFYAEMAINTLNFYLGPEIYLGQH